MKKVNRYLCISLFLYLLIILITSCQFTISVKPKVFESGEFVSFSYNNKKYKGTIDKLYLVRYDTDIINLRFLISFNDYSVSYFTSSGNEEIVFLDKDNIKSIEK